MGLTLVEKIAARHPKNAPELAFDFHRRIRAINAYHRHTRRLRLLHSNRFFRINHYHRRRSNHLFSRNVADLVIQPGRRA